MELSIVSNGRELPQHIDELKSLTPKVVGLSLDGLRDTHDSIRSSGSFDDVIRSMDLLKDAKIQTTIITTVSKLNFKQLPKMKDIIHKTGANWQIQVAMPFGNFSADHLITPEEYYATGMFIAVQRIKNRFQDLPVVGAHCFGYFSDVLPGSKGWNGCTAGIKSLGITSNGGIVGCLSMGNDRYVEGNIRDRKLTDIWNDPTSFPYNRKVSAHDMGENCSDCSHARQCRGGCNSMSQNLSGVFHNDPYCFRFLEKTL